MKLAATALLCSLAALAAHAQSVYRCGNAYSQAPCAQARIVAADDSRSAEQQAEARRVAADERRLAAEMHRDRLIEETRQRPALANSLSGAPAARPVAVAVAPPRAKKRRAALKLRAVTEVGAAQAGSRQRRARS